MTVGKNLSHALQHNTFTDTLQRLIPFFRFPFFSDSYSKLPQKTTSLNTYKKRKALADALRELEQEQAQVNWRTKHTHK